jgi:8-oxo-dGTP pyrophosphatase MutT (NUDIX family)
MLPVEGGVKRACGGHPAAHPPRAGCGERAYPRTDPVVIALVLSADGARALLGRGRSFPPGVFSCLAGYLEPGETLEQAVVREVAEEAGVSLEPARVASAGDDGTVKFFDVVSFDLITLARLGFFPSAAAWVYAPGSPQRILAVADSHNPVVTL